MGIIFGLIVLFVLFAPIYFGVRDATTNLIRPPDEKD